MELSSILPPGGRAIRLLATTRDDAIREMVLELAKTGLIAETVIESSIKILVDREHLASTAPGDGVAVPHARAPFQPNMAMCFGISEKGIDWNAADGQPVRVVILMLSGSSQHGQHLETLAEISRLLREESLAKRLLSENGENEL